MKTTHFLKQIFVAFFMLITGMIYAQDISLNGFFVDSLESEAFTGFFEEKIKQSQFTLIGEQHGIAEVSKISNALYSIGNAHGYKYFCIETDAVAAEVLEKAYSNPKNKSKLGEAIAKKFPFAIPFYNNHEDATLFTNIVKAGAKIWGIDQTFMVQFRLNLDVLANETRSLDFKNRLLELKTQAEEAYNKAVTEKDFMAPFLFKYSDEIHNSLLSMASTQKEKEIISKLKATKEIYQYFFKQNHYANNNERASLMKQNFMNYYNNAKKQDTLPKVMFKLGTNHVARGLSKTNVYDISNMVSELAEANGNKSLHLYVVGISGQQALGNPFAPPVAPFDNTDSFAAEIKDIVKEQEKKYFVLDLTTLRSKSNSYSKELQDLIFAYDVLICIKDANPLKGFYK